jgi:hypothetical protein
VPTCPGSAPPSPWTKTVNYITDNVYLFAARVLRQLVDLLSFARCNRRGSKPVGVGIWRSAPRRRGDGRRPPRRATRASGTCGCPPASRGPAPGRSWAAGAGLRGPAPDDARRPCVRHAGRGGDLRRYAFDLFHTATVVARLRACSSAMVASSFSSGHWAIQQVSARRTWSGATRARQSLTVKRAASSRRKDRECLPMLCDRRGPATNTQNPKE